MKKYEIYMNRKEFGGVCVKDIKPGCTLEDGDCDIFREVLKSFENKQDALEALKSYRTSITELSGLSGTYYLVEEFYVEENCYDDDGDFLYGGDILGFSEMRIELVEKLRCETIGTFDNFADVEKAYNDYDVDNEVYISF